MGGVMRYLPAVLAVAFVACSWPPWKPPEPTPPPPPPWECELEMPECSEVDQTCSTPESPCWHNPTQDPEHCEEAPACPPPPPPEPQCPTFTDRGGTERCQAGACDCYCGEEFIDCPEPPPPGDCPWGTPTARELEAQGARVEIRPKKEGRRAFGVTPLGAFGKDYYCQPGLWPEACAAQRNFGPVAPDGHPDRVMCEKQFLEQACATVSVTGGAQHMSLDPWIVQGGVNQNHPRNVEVCEQKRFEDDPSWVKEPYQGRLYIVRGEMSWTTAHGNGDVCAEAKGGAGKKCVRFTEP